MKVIFLLTFLIISLSGSSLTDQAIRYYSDGSLKNPTEVSLKTASYYRLFPQRKRQYGTDQLVTLIEIVSKELRAQFPEGERLGVGDLSAKRGGKISRHNSHQNGLDVDLNYLKYNYEEQVAGSSDSFEESFIDGDQISSNFDLERNWALLNLLHEHGDIGRIFVDSVIKKELCAQYRDKKNHKRVEILRRLRIWPHHDNHLHVRLKCPPSAKLCRPQPEPPSGDGCDDLKEDPIE